MNLSLLIIIHQSHLLAAHLIITRITGLLSLEAAKNQVVFGDSHLVVFIPEWVVRLLLPFLVVFLYVILLTVLAIVFLSVVLSVDSLLVLHLLLG